jgi:hypothetical protein
MEWSAIRQTYPHRWLLVEALEAHSQSGKRVLDNLSVVDSFPDGVAAMKGYKELHHRAPERELYVLHTDVKTSTSASSVGGESRWLICHSRQTALG